MVRNSNPRKYTMTLLSIFFVAVIGVVAVAPKPVNVELSSEPGAHHECIENYAPCWDADDIMLPCCRQQHFEHSQVIPEDFICFGFGKATCQPLSSIARLDKYAQLAKAREETNSVELLKQYNNELGAGKNSSTTPDLQIIATCTYHV